MAKKDVIWTFKLRMAGKSRLIFDDIFSNKGAGKADGLCISGGQIRASMKALARGLGLSDYIQYLFKNGGLRFGNAYANARGGVVAAIRMPVDAKTGVSAGTTIQPAYERGLEFNLDLDLRVAQKDEGRTIGVLAALLEAMKTDGLRVGRVQTRGYGRLILDGLQAGRYPVWTKKGVTAFLLRDLSDFSDNPTELLSGDVKDFETPEAASDNSIRFDLELRPVQGVVMPKGLDYIPGTMLAGVLRRHTLKVLDILRIDEPRGFVDSIFGVAGKTSRIVVDDVDMEGETLMAQSRVGLDDFTGGIIGDRAYRRTVVIRPILRCKIELTDAKDAEAGLLMLVLRDLVFGRLALGAEESVGFGICEGTVDISRGKDHWTLGANVANTGNMDVLNGFADALTGKSF